jgi:hypothetical protein
MHCGIAIFMLHHSPQVGMTLSLAYLIMKDAMAAWIPLVIEIAG